MSFFKNLSILLLMLLCATTLTGKDIESTFYYSLQFLKEASPPGEMDMVMVDNLSTGKSIISRGILFTYKNREAESVAIGGSFNNWKPHQMKRNKYGVWYYFQAIKEQNAEIKYKLLVNSIWIVDPENHNRIDDGAGSYYSVLKTGSHAEKKNIGYRIIEKNRVEFKIYRPDARFISIVGDFNGWNPENDLLHKQKNGIWKATLRIPPGTYRYKFIIDGEWVPDIYNDRSASDDSGEICSVLTIQ